MKRSLLFIYFFLILLLTGCWDQVPIEKRGFVVGTALDLVEDDMKDTPSIIMTNQIVLPSGMANPGQGGGEGGKQAYNNLSASGPSPFLISRGMLSLTDRILNYQHLKIILISNEIAANPDLFSSILDTFIRDHEMRRGIRVLVVDGEAKKLLNIQTNTEEVPSLFIETILDNNVKSLDLIEPVRIGAVHRYLLNDTSYVLPQMSVQEGEISYSGAALFDGKSDQQVGTLSGDDIKGLNLIKNRMTKGAIPFYVNDKLMIYEVKQSNSKVEIKKDNSEKFTISINIDVEGNIAEMFGAKSLLDESYIKKIEKNISKRIEEIINHTVNMAQNKYKIDFLGFRNKLKQKRHDEWKKIEGDWEGGDQLFSQSTVDVSVNVITRNIGTSDKAKK